MNGRNICRWLCPILILVIIILVWRRPWCPVIIDGTTILGGDSGKLANLVIEHVDAAAWAPVNNSFHNAVSPSRDSTYFWTGLLAQVGTFPETRYTLDSLALYDASGSVVFSSPLGDDDAFLWINICGRWTDTPISRTPITADEAFWLFPNKTLPDGCGGSDAVTAPGKVSDPCKRGRQIHPDMERVRAVISYWQGPHGFDARATQAYGPRDDKKFEFWFNDGFGVDMWKLDDHGDADPANDTFVPVEIPDDVTRIVVVAAKRSGPIEGKTQEPPWWYP